MRQAPDARQRAEAGEGVGIDETGLGVVRYVHRAMMHEKLPPRCA